MSASWPYTGNVREIPAGKSHFKGTKEGRTLSLIYIVLSFRATAAFSCIDCADGIDSHNEIRNTRQNPHQKPDSAQPTHFSIDFSTKLRWCRATCFITTAGEQKLSVTEDSYVQKRSQLSCTCTTVFFMSLYIAVTIDHMAFVQSPWPWLHWYKEPSSNCIGMVGELKHAVPVERRPPRPEGNLRRRVDGF